MCLCVSLQYDVTGESRLRAALDHAAIFEGDQLSSEDARRAARFEALLEAAANKGVGEGGAVSVASASEASDNQSDGASTTSFVSAILAGDAEYDFITGTRTGSMKNLRSDASGASTARSSRSRRRRRRSRASSVLSRPSVASGTSSVGRMRRRRAAREAAKHARALRKLVGGPGPTPEELKLRKHWSTSELARTQVTT